MSIWIALLYFIIGMCMGSFMRKLASDKRLNFSQRSKCDYCNKKLSWYELIPLFSRLSQGGKCRDCERQLSSDYIVSELLSGIVFMCIGYVIWIFPFVIQLWMGIITSLLLFCCFYDIKRKELSIVAFILLLMSTIGLYLSFFSRNTGSTYGVRTTLQYIPYEQYYGLLNEILISVFSWGGIRFLIWLLGAGIYYYKYKELGQGLGFGDVLFAGVLGSLLPFFMMIVSISFSGAEGLRIENYGIRSLGLIIYHILFSSILGIIGYFVFKESEFAFLPYMLGGFFCLAIAICIFPSYFLVLLGG